ncbi:MAG: hypothetical protein IMZ64_00365 [Bacteroidetes bacterium]|nr:hypothetical protein [Bacteroidota bacterium]
MKTKATFLFLILFAITFSFSALGQRANFSGEWKLNKEKTVLADNQLFLSRVTIQLKSDSLLTIRIYENANGEEYPFEENLFLDGKEYKIVIFDMPRTTKASRSDTDGSLIIESTTTFNGNNGEENLTAKETWKVDDEGETLTIGFTNKMSGGETVGTNYYNKIK